MSSTATAGKQPTTIHLTYNADGSVTGTPPAVFRKGDSVTFVSDSGGDAYVKLNPLAYYPSVFTPHSGPVNVIADSSGTTSPALCGIVKNVNGKNVEYGWIPSNVRSAINSRIPMSGIETEP